MVTRYDIEQWLNTQIEARRLQNIPLVIEEHKDGLDDRLSNLSAAKDIHLSAEAVRFVAEELDLDLCVKARKCEDYPYEIFVIYNGEIFMAIESEEEYRERGAVV